MLYKKIGSRYSEATEGEVIAEAVSVLHTLGREDVARELIISLVHKIGYLPPTEPKVEMKLPPDIGPIYPGRILVEHGEIVPTQEETERVRGIRLKKVWTDEEEGGHNET